MEIKVTDIKKELSNLNKLIEDYELTYLNLYNTINNMSFDWVDNYAKLFFEDVEKEKIKVSNTIDEMKGLVNIYNYLVDKYQSLGEKIKFNLAYKNDVLTKIDSCISQFNDVINIYRNFNLSLCGYTEANYIRNELSTLINNKNKLINYKIKVKDTINYIEEVEGNIKLKINNIKLELIEEQKVEDFV